jgi:hypothetical protein
LRRLVRLDRGLVKAFAWTLPVMNWLFFVVGLVGAVGTGIGLLPPFSNSLWAKATTILLWLLFAREGYEPIAERAEERTEKT